MVSQKKWTESQCAWVLFFVKKYTSQIVKGCNDKDVANAIALAQGINIDPRSIEEGEEWHIPENDSLVGATIIDWSILDANKLKVELDLPETQGCIGFYVKRNAAPTSSVKRSICNELKRRISDVIGQIQDSCAGCWSVSYPQLLGALLGRVDDYGRMVHVDNYGRAGNAYVARYYLFVEPSEEIFTALQRAGVHFSGQVTCEIRKSFLAARKLDMENKMARKASATDILTKTFPNETLSDKALFTMAAGNSTLSCALNARAYGMSHVSIKPLSQLPSPFVQSFLYR